MTFRGSTLIRVLQIRGISRRHRPVGPPCRLEALEPRRLLSTYYVATTGSDSGNGSAGSPFQTLQHAADRVGADDTVIVRAGTYDTGFVVGWNGPQAGTAGARITFEADPGAAPGSVVITGRNIKTPDGIDVEEGCDFVTIQGFNVDNSANVDSASTANSMTQSGIRVVSSANVSLLNNTCNAAGTWGIYASSSTDILIQGNTASNAQSQHGVYIANSSVRPVLRGNTIVGNAIQGLHLNGDGSVGGTGVITDALVENNIIHDNGSNGINCDGVQNSRFQNNVIYQNGNQGISLYEIDAGEASINNVIANNTIVQNAKASGAAIQLRNGATGAIIVNNILLGGRGGALSYSKDSLAGLVSDFNAVINRFQNASTRKNITLASWRTASQQDKHSFTTTAAKLFVDAPGHDFHLLSTGSAVDSGVKILGGQAAPLTDSGGNGRADTSWDLGALETGAPNPAAVAISNVAASKITTNGAVLTWTTSKSADSRFLIGTSSDYGTASPIATAAVKKHTLKLTGLLPGTVYHVQVISKDAQGTFAVAGDFMFTTLA